MKVQPRGEPSAEHPDAVPTLEIWRDARDRANDQIGKLQGAMRGTRHPVFVRVADQGLNGVTGRLQVGLQVALMEVDAATGPARAQARAKALSALEEFRSFLASDPVVPLLEANPMKVVVDLRGNLGQACTAIEQALSA